jgi:hypothetical protein
LANQDDEVYVLSGGHPLALQYLINRILAAEDQDEIAQVIRSERPFEGTIENQYLSHWHQIQSDEELVRLLALLSRLRRPANIEWLLSWTSPGSVERLFRAFGHLFDRSDEKNLRFFHDSFRVYVQKKTAGTLAPELAHRRFNLDLADICASSTEQRWKWEEMYHAHWAAEHVRVIKMATQQSFRDQALALRPLDDIDDDLKLAIRSASACKDVVAYSRILLAASEHSQRQHNLRESQLLALHERIAGPQVARDGNRLRVSRRLALEIANSLRESAGDEGKRLFELAQPLDLLRGRTSVDTYGRGDDAETLDQWAENSVDYLSLDQFLQAIGGLRVGDAYGRRGLDADEDSGGSERLQRRLAHIRCQRQSEVGNWARFEEELDRLWDIDKSAWFWAYYAGTREARRQGEFERAKTYTNTIESRVDIERMPSQAILALAELVFIAGGNHDRSEALFQISSPPALKKDSSYGRLSFDRFTHRISFTRLAYALGSDDSVEAFVPDEDDARLEGLVRFERAVCRVCRIWGFASAGRKLPDLSLGAGEVIRLFYQSRRSREWLSWWELQSLRPELYDLLIRAVSLCGTDELRELRSLFEAEWTDEANINFWSVGVRRHVVCEFQKHLPDDGWAASVLELLEGEISTAASDISSKVEEYQGQCDAWILLSCLDRAQQSLVASVEHAFGVPYSKDDQIERWISWLPSVTSAEADALKQALSWMPEALAGVGDSSESDIVQGAAEALLSVVGQREPGMVASLFQYMASNHIISFYGALTAIVESYMASSDWSGEVVSILTSNFAFPLPGRARPSWLRAAIERANVRRGRNKAIQMADDMWRRVRVYPLASVRSSWETGIRAGLKSAEIWDDRFDELANVDEGEGVSGAEFDDRSTQSRGELVERIHNLEDLGEALRHEREGSFFNWAPVIERLETLEPGPVGDVLELLGRSERGAIALASLSVRLRQSGFHAEARLAAQTAVSTSRAQGWDTLWDRGSRLIAFRALLAVEGEASREAVWKQLTADLTSAYWYPLSITRNLKDILELMVAEVPIVDIWHEIEEYLKAMFVRVPVSGAHPDIVSSGLSQSDSAILDFVRINLDHPIEIVRLAAKRSLAELMSATDLSDVLRDWLRVEDAQLPVLEVLLGLGSLAHLERLRSELVELVTSSDYGVRMLAVEACDRLGVDVEFVPRVATILSPIYSISLSELPDFDRTELPTGSALPDTTNPVELAGAWMPSCRALAWAGGVELDNLLLRVSAVMGEIDPERGWTFEGEERTRDELYSLGLKLPYRRPRAMLSRKAIFRVAAELLDAHQIPDERLTVVFQALRIFDPDLLLVEPEQRPSEIAPLPTQGSGVEMSTWTDEVEEALLNSLRSVGDWELLAEETRLKRLEWEHSTEIRRSLVHVSDDPTDPESFFPLVNDRFAGEYWRVARASNKTLVTKNFGRGFDSPGDSWLAFNPGIAREIGWHPADEGLFRWIDADGAVMVESRWWYDGIMDLQPYERDEVGEGWLVVASKEAYKLIREYVNQPLVRTIELDRRSDETEGRATLDEAA